MRGRSVENWPFCSGDGELAQEMAAAGGHRLEKVLRDGQWKDCAAAAAAAADLGLGS